MGTTVFVALGSNIDPADNLRRAVALLTERHPAAKVSSVYETPPQGFTEQANFLNMAVCLQTDLSIEAFKDFLQGIEAQLKRERDPNNKNAPRTIDLDIALWGDAILDYGEKLWHVPDKDIVKFAHVALPLAELAPQMKHPETQQTLADIAAAFDTDSIKIRADLKNKIG
jgi:2-amino-4-hydroxy-6-hydroxymethyldihydropteridine diphosphokinase